MRISDAISDIYVHGACRPCTQTILENDQDNTKVYIHRVSRTEVVSQAICKFPLTVVPLLLIAATNLQTQAQPDIARL